MENNDNNIMNQASSFLKGGDIYEKSNEAMNQEI